MPQNGHPGAAPEDPNRNAVWTANNTSHESTSRTIGSRITRSAKIRNRIASQASHNKLRAITIARLRSSLINAGAFDLFFDENGKPWHDLQTPWKRWKRTLDALKCRYREPYNARHTSVSWNLMIGKNPLWVAKQHGHSVQTMLDAYAAWTEGAKEADIEAIKRAMEASPQRASFEPDIVVPLVTPGIVTPGICHQTATSRGQERPKCLKNAAKRRMRERTGAERGIRTREPESDQ